jgi:hypothetical protein
MHPFLCSITFLLHAAWCTRVGYTKEEESRHFIETSKKKQRRRCVAAGKNAGASIMAVPLSERKYMSVVLRHHYLSASWKEKA